MKRSALYLAIALGALVTPWSARASLVEIDKASGHVVYDDVSGKYWVWDLHAFVNQTLAEQLTSIAANYAGANYFGNSTWHMATRDEAMALFSTYAAADIEIFNPVYVTYHYETIPPAAQIHWFGRWIGQDVLHGIDGVMDDTYFLASGQWSTNPQYMGNTLSDADIRYANMGAWVTTRAVPEPVSIALVCFGLAGLRLAHRRQPSMALS